MILAKVAWFMVLAAIIIVGFSKVQRHDGVIIVKSVIMDTMDESHTLYLSAGE